VSVVAAVRRHDGDSIVERVEFGFLPLASRTGVGGVFPDRKAHPSAVLTPLQIIGSFGVSFLLAVDDDQIGLDAAICRQSDRAVA
jgi:hypothetical protein